MTEQCKFFVRQYISEVRLWDGDKYVMGLFKSFQQLLYDVTCYIAKSLLKSYLEWNKFQCAAWWPGVLPGIKKTKPNYFLGLLSVNFRSLTATPLMTELFVHQRASRPTESVKWGHGGSKLAKCDGCGPAPAAAEKCKPSASLWEQRAVEKLMSQEWDDPAEGYQKPDVVKTFCL